MNGASYPSATIDNGNTYYTLEEAIEAAAESQTIKLFRNLDLTYYTKVSDNVTGKSFELKKNVTLDLNQKTITVNNYGVVWRGEDITIQNGEFVASGGGSYALFIRGNDDDSKLNASETKERANWTATLEKIETTGGVNVGCHKVVVKDCSIVGTKYYSLWADVLAQITVKSGTYVSDSSSSHINLNTVNEETSFIEILGGKFSTKNANDKLLGNNIKIKGGTFSADPTEYVANGYKAVKDSDANTWTVQKNTDTD